MTSKDEQKILAAWSAWQEFLAALRALGLEVQSASFEGREGKATIVELFGHIGLPEAK